MFRGLKGAVALFALVQPLLAGNASHATRRYACEASDLESIVGYTASASTNVNGEFEGAEYGKSVELANGMTFRFAEYHYAYSYHPDVIVFAQRLTLSGRSVVVYKLLIDDELYDAERVR